jgi:chromosome segregation ATPase
VSSRRSAASQTHRVCLAEIERLGTELDEMDRLVEYINASQLPTEARAQRAETERDALNTVISRLTVERDAAQARTVAAEQKVAEYENAITWDTSCLNCSQLLDRSIFDHERAQRAEAAVAKVHEVVDGKAGGFAQSVRAALAGCGPMGDPE